MNLYQAAISRENSRRPPVWFMRQAGRYHAHYQKIRKIHSFEEVCKNPEVACEATLGQIEDFDFDAAILFSDLLFPLEVMGMPLKYDPGPQLGFHLRSHEDLKRLKGGSSLVEGLQFQYDALIKIKQRLPASKGLIGFVGGPATLFFYAVEGSHKGRLDSACQGLEDGRWEGFLALLMPLLLENMMLQAKAGIDSIAVFDSCAGEIPLAVYCDRIVPVLHELFSRFRAKYPQVKITYYGKGLGDSAWSQLTDLPFDCLGVDWNTDIREPLQKYSARWAIQGNVDPHWMLLPKDELKQNLLSYFEAVKSLNPSLLRGWICGLGHGILPTTPEENVRLFLNLQKELFGHDSESVVH